MAQYSRRDGLGQELAAESQSVSYTEEITSTSSCLEEGELAEINGILTNISAPSSKKQLHTAQDVFSKVRLFVESWYAQKTKGTRLDVPPRNRDRIPPRLVDFGSMHLQGPLHCGSDIDMLFVVEYSPEFDDWKTQLKDFERFVMDCDGVSSICRFSMSAFTPPLIRFRIEGFHIDLQFARVPQDALRALHDESQLDIDWEKRFYNRMDPPSLLGLRAVAVSRRIVKYVPDLNRFRTLLRAVKTWAKRRKIYKHAFGYPGGIAWAIMVAKICHEYHEEFKEKSLMGLLEQFFKFYDSLDWGQENVVSLGDLGKGFNIYIQSRFMIVLTPERDPNNCCHNINGSSLEAIRKEFRRANRIMKNVRGSPLADILLSICEPHDFFIRYPVYLRFDIASWEKDEFYQGLTAGALRKFTSQVHAYDEILEVRLLPEAMLVDEEDYHPDLREINQTMKGRELHAYWIGLQFRRPNNDSPKAVTKLLDVSMSKLQQSLARTRDRTQDHWFSFWKREQLPDWVFPTPWHGQKMERPENWRLELIARLNPPPLMAFANPSADHWPEFARVGSETPPHSPLLDFGKFRFPSRFAEAALRATQQVQAAQQVTRHLHPRPPDHQKRRPRRHQRPLNHNRHLPDDHRFSRPPEDEFRRLKEQRRPNHRNRTRRHQQMREPGGGTRWSNNHHHNHRSNRHPHSKTPPRNSPPLGAQPPERRHKRVQNRRQHNHRHNNHHHQNQNHRDKFDHGPPSNQQRGTAQKPVPLQVGPRAVGAPKNRARSTTNRANRERAAAWRGRDRVHNSTAGRPLPIVSKLPPRDSSRSTTDSNPGKGKGRAPKKHTRDQTDGKTAPHSYAQKGKWEAVAKDTNLE